ncbi:Uncharacterised protein [Segatella copri]|nr:Uncharacterised protein [Segatella copri]
MLKPRVSREALAPHRALRIIIPSPRNVKLPLSFPPRFKARMPRKPMMQPNAFRHVILSLLKKMQARITTVKTLIELSIAERAPALCESPK